MEYTGNIKKDVLEVFFTSAEDKIYGVKPSIPPEMFGAFGSYFSRNPKDLREHVYDAITGQIDGQGDEPGISGGLEWLTTGDYREPYDAIRSGIKKSQDFFKKWYGKYSHKSIANTVWLPMVATNVSQLFARELAYDQLAFFIEQSTRYVVFDAKNFHMDKDVMASKHAGLYNDTLEKMGENYHHFINEASEYYRKLTPIENWLKLQNDDTLKMKDDAKKAKYEREIKAQALDVSRFLLPQAVKTNLAWILDARSTEFNVSAWKGHPLEEIVEAANLIEKHAGQLAPSLLKYTEKNEYYEDKLKDYNGELERELNLPFAKGIDIIDYDPDALDKVISHLLKRHNRGGTFRQRYSQAKNMKMDEKLRILKRVSEKRGSYDEWLETRKDFDLVKVCFEIKSDVGAIRDWRRHQKNERGEARYTLDNGYERPYMLKEMSSEANKIFEDSMIVSHDAEKQIRKEMPHQAQYLVPMAAMHGMTMSAGLDQLQYMIYTRSTPEGNFSYRQDAFNLAKALASIYPWMFGLEQLELDFNIIDAYKDAPNKNLVRLRTENTKLHQ